MVEPTKAKGYKHFLRKVVQVFLARFCLRVYESGPKGYISRKRNVCV